MIAVRIKPWNYRDAKRLANGIYLRPAGGEADTPGNGAEISDFRL